MASVMKDPVDHAATETARIDDSLLLVVDVQGRLARLMHGVDDMIRAQRIMIEACRLLDVPIVWAEQLPDKLGPTVDELQRPLQGLSACPKSSFGCLGDDTLRERIAQSGRRQVLLCGIEAHVCVWQTASALIALDYSVHLVADAVSSRSVFNRDIGFRRMQQAGVHSSCVEMVLFELMRNADHPRFREVSALLK